MIRVMRNLCAMLLAAALLFTGCGEGTPDPQETVATEESVPTSFALGGTLPELTFTDAQGTEFCVQDILEEKKLVVLNFWFAECGWCRKEFPVMEVAYQYFREDVEILAVNPYDSQEVITAFQKENGLTFPMLSCYEDLADAFGVNGYPTSVCIDREGKISLIHAGAITDAQVFESLFETYTQEGYRSRVYNSIYEIIQSADE